MSPFRKLILIFLLSVAALYISLPTKIPVKLHLGSVNFEKEFVKRPLNINFGRISVEKNFELVMGLDLAGGSHLVFEAETGSLGAQEKKEAMEALREVIERRVNLFGISEPNVQISSFEGKSRVIVELPGVRDTNQATQLIGQTAQLIFVEIEGEGEGISFKPTDLTGADLKKAQVTFDSNTGKPVVQLEFKDEGAKKFEEITGRNVGKQLPIFLDNAPISSPIVQGQIAGGSAIITGEFSLQEAKNLSIQLNAGALPIPVTLVEQRTVGPTLGAESVVRSVRAGLIGLFMVLVFMVLAYGRLGLVADLALLIFGALTLSLYKLIPIVLTLPGIAGFLLSVGMAVDSNILIFERLKEERSKRNFADAMEVSFGRAWDSIRDANIATLVTAFILANPLDFPFLHTSGPVRGFAVTLSLGIAISLFTGIVVSRNLLRVFIKEDKKSG